MVASNGTKHLSYYIVLKSFSRVQRRTKAILALYFLSPVVGEMVSGSSPPSEFFTAFGLIVLPLLYGGGALIIRELSVIWGKGWASILVMGLAYGIIEEGLMVKSFFDPSWVDIGILGEYGRFMGVNWVWTVMLTLFHCVFSIAIPILLVNLAFPDQAGKRWISEKWLKRLGVVFLANVIVGFLLFTKYFPGPLEYLVAAIVVILLFVIAHEIPANPLRSDGGLKRPRRFYFLGLLLGSGILLTGWVVPSTGVHPIMPIVMEVMLAVACLYAALSWSGSGRSWGEKHQLALASGALSFLFFMDLLLLLQGAIEMGVVALFAIAGLIALWWKVATKNANLYQASEAQGP